MEFSDEMLAARGLPPMAFLDNRDDLADSAGAVVAVKRGVLGCHAVVTTCTATELNRQHAVTPAQVQAMRINSLFGWHVPGAYPARWNEAELPS